MKPFDLERAKTGDPICLADKTPVHFVGIDRTGLIVIQYENNVLSVASECYLYMAPKITTYYVNIYKSVIDNKPAIGNILHASEKDAQQTRNHDDTYIKTISFEVEE